MENSSEDFQLNTKSESLNGLNSINKNFVQLNVRILYPLEREIYLPFFLWRFPFKHFLILMQSIIIQRKPLHINRNFYLRFMVTLKQYKEHGSTAVKQIYKDTLKPLPISFHRPPIFMFLLHTLLLLYNAQSV